MKTSLAIVASLIMATLFVSCDTKRKSNQQKKGTETLENIDWLLGQWKRINDEKGKQTFENWAKKSSSEYSGIGFTMQNGDTISQEKIMLTMQDKKWHLAVQVPNDEPVHFEMTKLTARSFTCENDSIDFPKKIQYWKDGDMMKASVSNDSMDIRFEFKQIN